MAEVFSEEDQIKMWETEIVMHYQTMAQTKKKGKNQKLIDKISAQLQNMIDENIAKIKQLRPSYKCPYNFDNVEMEEHSGFDIHAKKYSPTLDVKGLQSIYSGERAYNSENAEFLSAKEKEMFDKLNESHKMYKTEDKNEVKYDDATEELFKRLNASRPKEKTDVTEVADEVRSGSELDNSLLKQDFSTDYDLVDIPSHGECYKNKKKRLSVAYLTAYDENMITSPNLYEGNLITKYLLRSKVLDKDINIMDLTRGDADAILVWLRKTSYGNEYPVTITDNETGQPFEATINLDDLKFNEFKLKADENGLFTYNCERSKAEIKFKFLTIADMEALDTSIKIESEDVRKNYVGSLIGKIKNLIKMDKQIADKDKETLNSSMALMEKWTETKSSADYNFAYTVTDALERLIVSINGNTDRDYIKKFITRMPALDSLKFRKFVNENEPSVNFYVEVERPAGLGGGRIKTFLNWDKYVFANTANV